MTLAERCIAVRAKYNLSQQELSEALGMKSGSQISRIENGRHEVRKARDLRIMNLLNDYEKRMEEGQK
ncbi:MAG: helix-turn-helix transcriptional regulator [Oscillospiraceae bacterium]|nr:helix-turn-helix transcriptional regulator [Oscillospiraceae bacterium]